ncbi:hypothetical protein FisN_6Hh333 [Fistulifera solaris]|jgi:hypothetical protein|uniref:TFIIS N-terminal domain-containing protein n=1 Tax=Fistulifera solaris TaxID=1519565 RepID=A0A1Z5K7C7_FISSO|nr:hypothetical protein FisN_6Hh333 [Fistulifera solaris]|eukprot:GAX22085.1 hypothetical protein FisN_6Hh333 [Fistulifera solaris]
MQSARPPQQQQHTTAQRRDHYETSLVDLCRSVLVAHLEKYPPEVFGLCDPEEWDCLVQLRHQKTQPRSGSGGLDGSGRQAPALSEKILSQIEAHNRHLAESSVVDRLVWKDCVEFRFRRGGMSRPRALRMPWPELVKTIQTYMATLEDDDENARSLVILLLQESPMNVALLQATGVGKMLRKLVKRYKEDKTIPASDIEVLEETLQSWKALASDAQSQQSPEDEALLKDMELAEKCWSWRQLFAALKERQDNLRTCQGKKMREAREKLALDRPKVVKVRPATAKQNSILERPSTVAKGTSTVAPVSKFSKIRQEAVQSHQRLVQSSSKRNGSSFGDAVAFASATKKRKIVGRTAGGKVMQVPSMAPRQMPASKTQKMKTLLQKR